ncbi:hypothetical protein IFM89_017087 [Coptis chinensis]|uniref:SEC12-like protein 1 n=1 Tax=Coptis chinensis TaxID=261450 RepID=A0A835HFR7_9MAGN|nr:hypothetical protein IFM89_017087 [Coptis chinensis]
MEGHVRCASWIRRPENAHLVIMAKSTRGPSSSSLEVLSFDAKTCSLSSSPEVVYECEEDILSIAVHPSGDDIVCSTTKGGCKLHSGDVRAQYATNVDKMIGYVLILFELCGRDENLNLVTKDSPPLQGVGLQKCLAFSVDGSRFAIGGEDGHLRIFEWPSLRILLDEPKAHKSFRDMDFSLDTEFLASTSADGSARVWKIDDGVPLTSLTRNSDERIECCRFSKDGSKPFLFCTVQKGDKAVTAVWDISTWNRIGHKRLLRKPAAILSISLDGKYLALGSKDGDLCVVEVKKMEISHWSKRLHPGTCISSLEFCPSERLMLSTSSQWGGMVTKLSVPADWKEWQIYMVLLGLFLASAILFYIFFQNSDSFWNFPLGHQSTRPKFEAVFVDPHSEDQNVWGPLDL